MSAANAALLDRAQTILERARRLAVALKTETSADRPANALVRAVRVLEGVRKTADTLLAARARRLGRLRDGEPDAAVEEEAEEALADHSALLDRMEAAAGLRPAVGGAEEASCRGGPSAASAAAAADLRYIEELGDSTAPDGLEEASRMRWLAGAVRELRATERDWDFQAELLADQVAVAGSSGYTRSNFAYGSTPFSTFRRALREVPAARAAAADCAAGRGAFLVFGSSVGWLLFYAAALLGPLADVEGYEILPCLAARAEAVARREGCPARIRTVVGDMLSADVSRARLVVLASLCWDPGLARKVGAPPLPVLEALGAPLRPAQAAAKLAGELPAGGAVVDYQRGPLREAGLEEVGEVPGAATSWDEGGGHQSLFIFLKR
eukprot:tig00000743_g3868.t1